MFQPISNGSGWWKKRGPPFASERPHTNAQTKWKYDPNDKFLAASKSINKRPFWLSSVIRRQQAAAHKHNLTSSSSVCDGALPSNARFNHSLTTTLARNIPFQETTRIGIFALIEFANTNTRTHTQTYTSRRHSKARKCVRNINFHHFTFYGTPTRNKWTSEKRNKRTVVKYTASGQMQMEVVQRMKGIERNPMNKKIHEFYEEKGAIYEICWLLCGGRLTKWVTLCIGYTPFETIGNDELSVWAVTFCNL